MPGPERKPAKAPPLATLVEQTQREMAATTQALRAHGTRLGELRRQLRARIPARRFERAITTFDHSLATALAAGLDEQLLGVSRLVADLEAAAAATEARPAPRPSAEELVLVELLGKRDRFAALLFRSCQGDQRLAAAGARPQPLPPGALMPSTAPPLPPQTLKSERIQAPSAWEFSADQTSASARFELGSRRGAVAFIGLASEELAEQVGAKAGFQLTGDSAVLVTVEAEEGGTFSPRGLELLAAFNRLLGDEASL